MSKLMNSNKCPNCGTVAMSFFKKAFYSPYKSFDCPNCDCHIGLSVSNTFIITFIFIAIGKFIETLGINIWLILSIAIPLIIFIQAFFTKLVIKNKDNQIE